MSKVKLGDVAIESRETYKGDKSGLPIVGLEHITPEEVTLSNWATDTENTFTKMFRKGDMLFGRRRAYLKKAAQAPFDGICSGDITVIRAKADKLLPDLLPFIIQNDDLFDFAVGKSAGSLSPRVKWENLKNYAFELPSLDEQKKLAEVLWSINDTIQAYQKLLAETDELVKSQFIEMFEDVENCVRLDELCVHFGDGDWIESKDQSEDGIRLIQTGNVGNGEYKDKGDKARYISEDTFSRLGCTEVFPGDILISRLPDPIGRACIVPEMPKSITAVDCTIVRLKNEVLPTFFVNFTKTPMYTMQIDSFTTGSTRKRVSRANLGSVMVPVPKLDLQRQFVAFAEQSDKSKLALQSVIISLQATKRSIIDEAFGIGRKE